MLHSIASPASAIALVLYVNIALLKHVIVVKWLSKVNTFCRQIKPIIISHLPHYLLLPSHFHQPMS